MYNYAKRFFFTYYIKYFLGETNFNEGNGNC